LPSSSTLARGMSILLSCVSKFLRRPRYGKNNMLWYISVCSMIGGISVSVTTGLGAAIVTTASGDNQVRHGFMMSNQAYAHDLSAYYSSSTGSFTF
jgi:hypothetical protein